MGENRTNREMECKEVRRIEVKRREERTAKRNDTLIPGLPIEMAILCIARVPRSNHQSMSGVSRSWRNLLHGTVLSEVRRELSLTEEWLYLWTDTADVWRCFDPCIQKWFKLPTMPRDNRIPGFSSFASFDGKIFVIGGCLEKFYHTNNRCIPCRTVSYFDVRSYCWKRAGDLNIARAQCMVGIIENQMYVFGGNIEGTIEGLQDTTITAEVYDPIMDTWRFVSSMKYALPIYDSAVMGGKFYGYDGVVFDAKMDKWEDMADGLTSGWSFKTTILNGKLFTIMPEIPDDGNELEIDEVIRIQVYNPSKDTWERVGTWDTRDEWDAPFSMHELELVSFCGKLCILLIWTDGFGPEAFSSILMGILEVNESTESPTCSTTSTDQFEIDYEYPDCQPLAVKRCHVIAL